MAQVLKGFFQQNPWKYKALYGMQHGDPKEKQLTGGEGPFHAYYQGFGVDGCSAKLNNPRECYSLGYEWNRKEFWELNQHQQNAYEHVRRKYLTYDYCTKTSSPTPECKINY